MEEKLFFEAYKNFFVKFPEHSTSSDTIKKSIRDDIAPVAYALGIARLEVDMMTPQTSYNVTGIREQGVIYSEETWGDQPFSKEYTTGENGFAKFSVYPRPDIIWGEAEKENITFLLKNIFFITGRERMMEIMSNMLVTDAMTGLLNTPGAINRCNRYIEHKEISRYTALFINLKNFKYINQRVGTESGNTVLRLYAKTVHQMISPGEIFARVGGDNFFMLIRNENVKNIISAIESVDISIEHNKIEVSFKISPRIGVYEIKDDDNINDIMNGSSIALAEAKESVSGNVMWFQHNMLEKAVMRKGIANDLPKALEKREFVVRYQPKVSLNNNSLWGGEALVRWIKDGKTVPPMEFIPILEKEGYVCAIDFYVLDQVCRDIRGWLDAGIEPVRISVNFSKINLYNKNLPQDIFEVLDRYSIDPQYIEIELTETSGYEDLDNLNDFLNAMSQMGISTSLDDFGTGYSSLNLLKDLNVDIIKLDGSFFKDMKSADDMEGILIKNIVKMIKDLKMLVVAEGVETAEQVELLKSIHCQYVQGYYFDKPLHHDDFEKCLTGERTYVK